jgi:hypothetical protein
MSSASFWRFNMADSEARCIESLRHTRVKVHDRGTNVSAVFLNPEKRKVERIRIDGCLAPARQTAADFLVSMPSVVDVIVELKGTDLRKAFEQVEATLDFLHQRKNMQKKPPNSQIIGILIVCAEYPSKNPRIQRKRDSLGKRGFRVLISTHNGSEYDFSTFIEKRH